ncbi:M91 family zinc metallopeptidase [Burkholderia cepacia]|uniref:M91 family zinc metallopeptidase n=1 Tax=Burkholderia cepacia TaxID=292 RepID=UPI00158CADCF|nr:M91 family zinc metallopeptidase [Burkholderia cepacia]
MQAVAQRRAALQEAQLRGSRRFTPVGQEAALAAFRALEESAATGEIDHGAAKVFLTALGAHVDEAHRYSVEKKAVDAFWRSAVMSSTLAASDAILSGLAGTDMLKLVGSADAEAQRFMTRRVQRIARVATRVPTRVAFSVAGQVAPDFTRSQPGASVPALPTLPVGPVLDEVEQAEAEPAPAGRGREPGPSTPSSVLLRQCQAALDNLEFVGRLRADAVKDGRVDAPVPDEVLAAQLQELQGELHTQVHDQLQHLRQAGTADAVLNQLEMAVVHMLVSVAASYAARGAVGYMGGLDPVSQALASAASRMLVNPPMAALGQVVTNWHHTRQVAAEGLREFQTLRVQGKDKDPQQIGALVQKLQARFPSRDEADYDLRDQNAFQPMLARERMDLARFDYRIEETSEQLLACDAATHDLIQRRQALQRQLNKIDCNVAVGDYTQAALIVQMLTELANNREGSPGRHIGLDEYLGLLMYRAPELLNVASMQTPEARELMARFYQAQQDRGNLYGSAADLAGLFITARSVFEYRDLDHAARGEGTLARLQGRIAGKIRQMHGGVVPDDPHARVRQIEAQLGRWQENGAGQWGAAALQEGAADAARDPMTSANGAGLSRQAAHVADQTDMNLVRDLARLARDPSISAAAFAQALHRCGAAVLNIATQQRSETDRCMAELRLAVNERALKGRDQGQAWDRLMSDGALDALFGNLLKDARAQEKQAGSVHGLVQGALRTIVMQGAPHETAADNHRRLDMLAGGGWLDGGAVEQFRKRLRLDQQLMQRETELEQVFAVDLDRVEQWLAGMDPEQFDVARLTWLTGDSTTPGTEEEAALARALRTVWYLQIPRAQALKESVSAELQERLPLPGDFEVALEKRFDRLTRQAAASAIRDGTGAPSLKDDLLQCRQDLQRERNQAQERYRKNAADVQAYQQRRLADIDPDGEVARITLTTTAARRQGAVEFARSNLWEPAARITGKLAGKVGIAWDGDIFPRPQQILNWGATGIGLGPNPLKKALERESVGVALSIPIETAIAGWDIGKPALKDALSPAPFHWEHFGADLLFRENDGTLTIYRPDGSKDIRWNDGSSHHTRHGDGSQSLGYSAAHLPVNESGPPIHAHEEKYLRVLSEVWGENHPATQVLRQQFGAPAGADPSSTLTFLLDDAHVARTAANRAASRETTPRASADARVTERSGADSGRTTSYQAGSSSLVQQKSIGAADMRAAVNVQGTAEKDSRKVLPADVTSGHVHAATTPPAESGHERAHAISVPSAPVLTYDSHSHATRHIAGDADAPVTMPDDEQHVRASSEHVDTGPTLRSEHGPRSSKRTQWPSPYAARRVDDIGQPSATESSIDIDEAGDQSLRRLASNDADEQFAPTETDQFLWGGGGGGYSQKAFFDSLYKKCSWSYRALLFSQIPKRYQADAFVDAFKKAQARNEITQLGEITRCLDLDELKTVFDRIYSDASWNQLGAMLGQVDSGKQLAAFDVIHDKARGGRRGVNMVPVVQALAVSNLGDAFRRLYPHATWEQLASLLAELAADDSSKQLAAFDGILEKAADAARVRDMGPVMNALTPAAMRTAFARLSRYRYTYRHYGWSWETADSVFRSVRPSMQVHAFAGLRDAAASLGFKDLLRSTVRLIHDSKQGEVFEALYAENASWTELGTLFGYLDSTRQIEVVVHMIERMRRDGKIDEIGSLISVLRRDALDGAFQRIYTSAGCNDQQLASLLRAVDPRNQDEAMLGITRAAEARGEMVSETIVRALAAEAVSPTFARLYPHATWAQRSSLLGGLEPASQLAAFDRFLDEARKANQVGEMGPVVRALADSNHSEAIVRLLGLEDKDYPKLLDVLSHLTSSRDPLVNYRRATEAVSLIYSDGKLRGLGTLLQCAVPANKQPDAFEVLTNLANEKGRLEQLGTELSKVNATWRTAAYAHAAEAIRTASGPAGYASAKLAALGMLLQVVQVDQQPQAFEALVKLANEKGDLDNLRTELAKVIEAQRGAAFRRAINVVNTEAVYRIHHDPESGRPVKVLVAGSNYTSQKLTSLGKLLKMVPQAQQRAEFDELVKLARQRTDLGFLGEAIGSLATEDQLPAFNRISNIDDTVFGTNGKLSAIAQLLPKMSSSQQGNAFEVLAALEKDRGGRISFAASTIGSLHVDAQLPAFIFLANDAIQRHTPIFRSNSASIEIGEDEDGPILNPRYKTMENDLTSIIDSIEIMDPSNRLKGFFSALKLSDNFFLVKKSVNPFSGFSNRGSERSNFVLDKIRGHISNMPVTQQHFALRAVLDKITDAYDRNIGVPTAGRLSNTFDRPYHNGVIANKFSQTIQMLGSMDPISRLNAIPLIIDKMSIVYGGGNHAPWSDLEEHRDAVFSVLREEIADFDDWEAIKWATDQVDRAEIEVRKKFKISKSEFYDQLLWDAVVNSELALFSVAQEQMLPTGLANKNLFNHEQAIMPKPLDAGGQMAYRNAARRIESGAGLGKIKGSRIIYGENHNDPVESSSVQQDAARVKLTAMEFSSKIRDYTESNKFRGIKIKNPNGKEVSKKFGLQVHKALDAIAKTADGRRLLNAIRDNCAEGGNEIFISPTISSKESSGIFGQTKTRSYHQKISKDWLTGEERIGTYNRSYLLDEESAYNSGKPGVGASSFIDWDPENSLAGDDGGIPAITLAHELIHAERKQSGNSVSYRHMHDAHKDTNSRDNHHLEESMTVGLINGYPFSENNIREQMGLKRREHYFPPKKTASQSSISADDHLLPPSLKSSGVRVVTRGYSNKKYWEKDTHLPGVTIMAEIKSEHVSFFQQVVDALAKIESKPTGRALLESIRQSGLSSGQGAGINDGFGYKVCIMPAAISTDESASYVGGNKTKSSSADKSSTPGKGAQSVVYWNPTLTRTPDGERPAFIGLAHELIHAQRNLYGNSIETNEALQRLGATYTNSREADEHQVVGFWQWRDQPITENKIRAEHGVPQRLQYSGLISDVPREISKIGDEFGGGSQKDVFYSTEYGDRCVAIIRPGTTGLISARDAAEKEMADYRILKSYNLPIVECYGVVKYRNQFGIERKLVRGAIDSDDVIHGSIKLPNGEQFNKKIKTECERIIRLIKENNLSIDDFQMIIDGEGNVFINDFRGVKIGNSQRTIDTLSALRGRAVENLLDYDLLDELGFDDR